MIYIFISNILEGKPLIDKYNLKKNLTYKKYEVFEGNEINIIICKSKLIYPALIIGDYFSNKEIKNNDFLLNIGTCGSSSCLKNETYVVNKINSFIMDKSLYPSMIYDLNLKEKSLYSSKSIVKEQINDYDLFDLEAYSIFLSAQFYFNNEQIIILKTVLDNLSNVDQFTKDDIYEVMNNYDNIINRIIEISHSLINTKEDTEKTLNFLLENLFNKYKFTNQMRINLSKHLTYLYNKDKINTINHIENIISKNIEIKSKDDLKKVYNELLQ